MKLPISTIIVQDNINLDGVHNLEKLTYLYIITKIPAQNNSKEEILTLGHNLCQNPRHHDRESVGKGREPNTMVDRKQRV